MILSTFNGSAGWKPRPDPYSVPHAYTLQEKRYEYPIHEPYVEWYDPENGIIMGRYQCCQMEIMTWSMVAQKMPRWESVADL